MSSPRDVIDLAPLLRLATRGPRAGGAVREPKVSFRADFQVAALLVREHEQPLPEMKDVKTGGRSQECR
jgi:hypothetical protein